MDKGHLILWAKRKEIEALREEGDYFAGKAQAYSEIWEQLVFNGRTVAEGAVSPVRYNEENEKWSERVAANERGIRNE